MLTKYSRFLSLILCVFVLSACTKTSQQDVIVTPMPEMSSADMIPQRAPQKDYGSLPNYDYQITNASNGDVTVYSLDGAAPAIAPRIEPNMTPPPVMGVQIENLYQRPTQMPQMAMGNSSGRVSTADEQLFFKFGSSRLGSIDKQKIASFADKAKFAPVNHITVEGYASTKTQAGEGTIESHILNLKESMNRSFAVSKSLMQNGLPAEKIKTVSYGATKATGDDRFDRRVDMYLGDR